MGKLDKVIALRNIAQLSGCPITLRCAVKMSDALEGKPYDITSALKFQDVIREEGNMKEHWICYVEGTDGGTRFRHSSLESAEREAERLARLTGKRVYIYEYKGSCIEQPITWDIPRRDFYKWTGNKYVL